MANARAHRRDVILAFATIGASLLFGCETSRQASEHPVHNPTAVATGKLHQCASCHGGDGVSTAEIFPNLAGQQKAYLVAQLTAFRDHTRQDRDAKSHMWGVATSLSDATITVLATYYSAKSPAVAAAGARPDIAAGEAIYKNGVEAHGVLACVSCHGAKAVGNDVAPTLAGQHQDYITLQLEAFASGSRNNAIMHPIAKALTPKEIQVVAGYLASL